MEIVAWLSSGLILNYRSMVDSGSSCAIISSVCNIFSVLYEPYIIVLCMYSSLVFVSRMSREFTSNIVLIM